MEYFALLSDEIEPVEGLLPFLDKQGACNGTAGLLSFCKHGLQGGTADRLGIIQIESVCSIEKLGEDYQVRRTAQGHIAVHGLTERPEVVLRVFPARIKLTECEFHFAAELPLRYKKRRLNQPSFMMYHSKRLLLSEKFFHLVCRNEILVKSISTGAL